MIREGMQWIEEKTVEEHESAISMKSGTLQVYSTPSMTALMEYTSWRCISRELENGLTTVGVHISIDHLKPTAIGKTVKCISTVTGMERKKIFFNVEVYCGEVLIGKAAHIRYIVESDAFMKSLNNG